MKLGRRVNKEMETPYKALEQQQCDWCSYWGDTHIYQQGTISPPCMAIAQSQGGGVGGVGVQELLVNEDAERERSAWLSLYITLSRGAAARTQGK